MADKQKFELEFLFRSSPAILFNSISTPSGLSEWFSDDVNLNKDYFIFIWDGSEERARLLNQKKNDYIRFRWERDEEDGDDSYFEMRLKKDSMTREVALIVTDFAEEDEIEEAQLLWTSQMSELRQHIGA